MDAELITMREMGLEINLNTDRVILELDYELLRHNPAQRQKMDCALKGLVRKRIIEIAVSDDLGRGRKTLTVYRYGCAPALTDGHETVLIKNPLCQ